MRAAGILLHPTALPGRFAIGDLGPEAYRFVDWLKAAGQRLWQVLPLGPVDIGHGSPYAARSSIAGNPLLISPERLMADGLLLEQDLGGARNGRGRVEFARAAREKSGMLRAAFARLDEVSAMRARCDAFARTNAGWLDDWALFEALRQNEQTWWLDWPKPLMRHRRRARRDARHSLGEELAFHRFVQFVFWDQWMRLRHYANARGIRIVGDVPFYAALDSVDVWAHPGAFALHWRTRRPRYVGGVPPDAFSQTGQRWGMPCYAWRRQRLTGFPWWLARFRALASMVDVVRIDHFRGFAAYWRIPAEDRDATRGTWTQAPGAALFGKLRRILPTLEIWAEDLGFVTPDVIALRDRSGFASTRILLYAFDGGPDNPHRPRNHPENAVVYTGTHDNDTVVGWWSGLDDPGRARVATIVQSSIGDFDDARPHESLCKLALSSRARACVLPIQDVLGLDNTARFNLPGSTHGNWSWRLAPGALDDSNAARLAKHTLAARR